MVHTIYTGTKLKKETNALQVAIPTGNHKGCAPITLRGVNVGPVLQELAGHQVIPRGAHSKEDRRAISPPALPRVATPAQTELNAKDVIAKGGKVKAGLRVDVGVKVGVEVEVGVGVRPLGVRTILNRTLSPSDHPLTNRSISTSRTRTSSINRRMVGQKPPAKAPAVARVRVRVRQRERPTRRQMQKGPSVDVKV